MEKRFGSIATLALLGMVIGGCGDDSGSMDSAEASKGTSNVPADADASADPPSRLTSAWSKQAPQLVLCRQLAPLRRLPVGAPT